MAHSDSGDPDLQNPEMNPDATDASDLGPGPEDRQAEFSTLLREFTRDYLPKQDLGIYDRCRKQGRRNFKEVCAAADRNAELGDLVITKLLPHVDGRASRETGAWVHIAPSAMREIKAGLEGGGKVRKEDWSEIAHRILQLVKKCAASVAELEPACVEFSSHPLSKGFQTGLITPILNALRPDDYLLINVKPRKVLGWLTDSRFSPGLKDYPRVNAVGRNVIARNERLIREVTKSDSSLYDLFDQFCHWMVAVRKYFDGDGGPKEVRYWKVAPEEHARLWTTWVRDGIASIGWNELGDLTHVDHTEFVDQMEDVIAHKPPGKGWNKSALRQVWKFRQIRPGDRIIANQGTRKIVGIGTVTGPYRFVPGQEHAHHIAVHWDDQHPRSIEKRPGWQRTLVPVSAEEFQQLTGLTAESGPNSECPFRSETFELLASLRKTPTAEFYKGHKDEFVDLVEKPLQDLLRAIVLGLPEGPRAALETEKNIFARIPKNDYGRGGAWPYYWGALYPKNGARIRDAQLFLFIDTRRLDFGFYVGEYGGRPRELLRKNLKLHRTTIEPILEDSLGTRFGFGSESDVHQDAVLKGPGSLQKWLDDPGVGARVGIQYSPAEVLARSTEQLVSEIGAAFADLYPLMLLATSEDPIPTILEYIEGPTPTEVQPVYSIENLAMESGFDSAVLRRWVQAIHRKKQAIIYGPPGTGKTFVAEHLARHLIGGGTGFSKLIQFHPAYAYEDFIQGIRPRTSPDGTLIYDIAKGQFLNFCEQAGRTKDICVLVIDEINRANLARVFGELMYLLEYRDKEVPLAGGGLLRIPSNVRVIGTMNTADRSIALVDHALRRRFAFLHLPPSYDALREFHLAASRGFVTNGLIETLRWVNGQIGDPHYEIGVSFFMRENLDSEIEDIWRMEILPYLEEYFFDQPEKVKSLQWDQVRGRIRP